MHPQWFQCGSGSGLREPTSADPCGSGSWSEFAITKRWIFYMKNIFMYRYVLGLTKLSTLLVYLLPSSRSSQIFCVTYALYISLLISIKLGGGGERYEVNTLRTSFRGLLEGVCPENGDFFGTCSLEGYWKGWALKFETFLVPAIFEGHWKRWILKIETFGPCHFEGHWKGRALKIETFLGPAISLGTISEPKKVVVKMWRNMIKCKIDN